MSAVHVTPAVDSSWWRVGRRSVRVGVAACGFLFAFGVVLWARDGDLTAALWSLPDSWSEADLRNVSVDAGIPTGALSVYVMVLELLAATAGLTAALLVLRGATTWFHLYVAAAIAVWVTMGGTVPVLYAAVLDGAVAELPGLVQGLGWVAVFPLAYLFPDGRFVPGWTRWAAVGWAAYLPTLGVAVLLGYGSDPDSLVETLPLLVLFGTCVIAAAYRYRRVSTPEQRLQTRGVVAALGLWFVVALLSIATPLRTLIEQVSGAGLTANALVLLGSYLVSVLLPASIAVAVLRYRLYDVDVWVDRVLVYAVLTVTVVGSYALLAALAGLVWHDDDLAAPLVATVVMAVALHPLRLRAQRWVDRFVYGGRREPHTVLTNLGRRLEGVLQPDRVLQTLVHEVGATLKLAYVAAAYGDVVVTWPEGAVARTDRAQVLPLRWQGQDLGTLVIASRPGDYLTPSDLDLLEGLARQAGAAVRAATLTDDLRKSRERILVTREDERRRLQRDLHDGLGPTLASLYQRVDAARSLLGDDPAAADRLLADVAEQTRTVIGDIRSLVRELYPPELDELGLTAALEAAGSRFDDVEVRVTAADLPSLRPVVEAAAYRIGVEALTNVARHAGATAATVRLHVADGALVVSVLDNGHGIEAGARFGTGMRSMRERADEMGGSCEVVTAPGGTSVRALIPLQVVS